MLSNWVGRTFCRDQDANGCCMPDEVRLSVAAYQRSLGYMNSGGVAYIFRRRKEAGRRPLLDGLLKHPPPTLSARASASVKQRWEEIEVSSRYSFWLKTDGCQRCSGTLRNCVVTGWFLLLASFVDCPRP